MFFNPADPVHRAQVRQAHVQALNDDPTMIEAIETQIIDAYRVRLGPRDTLQRTDTSVPKDRDYYYDGADAPIWLAGYDPDPEKCEPQLVRALVRAIGTVFSHRMSQRGLNPLHTSISAGAQGVNPINVQLRLDANNPFPDGWDAELSQFDMRDKSNEAPLVWGF